MTFDQFSQHMTRLVNQFGSNSYSSERLKIFFRELHGVDVRVWERVVDTLLAESRFAPMLSDIREQVSKERERLAQMQKVEHRRDAEEFWTALNQDEAEFVFKNLKRRISGEMGEQDFEAFQNILKTFQRSENQ